MESTIDHDYFEFSWTLRSYQNTYKSLPHNQMISSRRFWSPRRDIIYSPEDGDNPGYLWCVDLYPQGHSDHTSHMSVYLTAWQTRYEKTHSIKCRLVGYVIELYKINPFPISNEDKLIKLSGLEMQRDYFKMRMGTDNWGLHELCSNNDIFGGDSWSNVDLVIKVKIHNNLHGYSGCAAPFHLGHSFEKYYDQDKFSDVEFVFDCGNRVRAHRVILAACSDYFKRLLCYGKVDEKVMEEESTNELDCSADESVDESMEESLDTASSQSSNQSTIKSIIETSVQADVQSTAESSALSNNEFSNPSMTLPTDTSVTPSSALLTTIPIQDIPYEVFKPILYYLYTGNVQLNLSFDTLFETWEYSTRLDLPHLSSIIISHFACNVSFDNWDRMLLFGWTINNIQLKTAVFQFAVDNWDSIVESDNMKAIMQADDKEIFEQLVNVRDNGVDVEMDDKRKGVDGGDGEEDMKNA